MSALHEHNEREITERLVGRLRLGETLALVSDAGTPLISDPGYPLVHACREQGLPVVPVPGPSALIAALSVSGLPTDRFRFEGFPPRKAAARQACFAALAREDVTMVFYESSHRVLDTCADLCAAFGQDRPAVLARELTKKFETVHAAPLGGLCDWLDADVNQRRGEFVLMIGGAPTRGEQTLVGNRELLLILLEELPVRQAVAIAARITGEKKNTLYRQALELAD